MRRGKSRRTSSRIAGGRGSFSAFKLAPELGLASEFDLFTTLSGGEGQDVLIGSGGADIFVINILGDNDMIQDFDFGEDIIGLSDGITFDQLTITQGDGAAILSYQDQAIASVSGATPDQIGADNFTTI
jgi:Ca2+-binding RTX toxin-like protein